MVLKAESIMFQLIFGIGFIIDNSSLKYEVPIDMNNKDITGVNKITTRDLDVNNQIDMKSKKIIRVGDGIDNSDAVNKAQIRCIGNIYYQYQSVVNHINYQYH